MKIEIEIPKEFEEHFKQDKFEDALYRLSADAHLIAGNYEQETAIMLIKAFKESKKDYDWIPVSERLPENDSYIMVSFDNFSLPDIGRYESDADGGGAFYPGDDDKSYVQYGLFVNAWRPLPELYREESEAD